MPLSFGSLDEASSIITQTKQPKKKMKKKLNALRNDNMVPLLHDAFLVGIIPNYCEIVRFLLQNSISNIYC